MTFTLAKKLILSFLGLTLIVLAATLGLARWSFEQGFLDYVNALEQGRLEILADDLAVEYRNAGDRWSDITSEKFNRLLLSGFPDKRPPPRARPAPSRLRPAEGKPSRDSFERGGPERFRPPPPLDGSPPGAPPTVLYDADGKQVAGITLPGEVSDHISVPINVKGVSVGEVRSAPRRHFNSPQETAFSRQQLVTSVLIGIISLLLAITVSLILTKILLAPIRRMLQSVSTLSSGDYSVRMHEDRRDELGQLMGDLDQLAHTLEENQTSRKRWLADISHELRTPVTVLTGEIETMKDGIRPIDMEQILSLDQEIIRLRSLIDDLYELSVSDIGGLRYSFTATNPVDEIKGAIDHIRNRANESGIEIQLDGELSSHIKGDSQRLDQLFSNLLENSLAYTDSPGRIEITLQETADEITVCIDDTPTAVNESDCIKLFDPLYRQEASRSRRTAGAGLGLAICKNIVEAHNGTISASPSRLGGLCVRVVFPKFREL